MMKSGRNSQAFSRFFSFIVLVSIMFLTLGVSSLPLAQAQEQGTVNTAMATAIESDSDGSEPKDVSNSRVDPNITPTKKPTVMANEENSMIQSLSLDNNDSLLVYKNDKYNFSFLYPSALTYETWEPTLDILTSISFYTNDSIYYPGISEIAVTVFNNSEQMEFDDWVNFHVNPDMDNLQPDLKGSAALFEDANEQKKMDINGSSAILFSQTSANITAGRLLLDNGSQIISITYTDTGDGGLKKAYEIIVSSLQITNNDIEYLSIDDVTAKTIGNSVQNFPSPSSLESQDIVTTSTGYKLPWVNGVSHIVTQGWGGSFSHNNTQMWYAYDFDMWEGEEIRSARGGTVTDATGHFSACGGYDLRNSANRVTIDHNDGSATLYLHLLSVDVSEEDEVTQGDRIGLAGKTGYTGCNTHLHFQRQEQGIWITDSLPIYFDEYPGVQLNTGSPYKSQNEGGSSDDCPGPSLNSPSNGAVLGNQTITFSWSAPSGDGCGDGGYQFRIKDTSDMNSGGTTIVDTGVGGTSRTETIGEQWNNQDLYWGVRTADPLSPNWSVHSFRIEPGSSTDCNDISGSGVKLFDSINCSSTPKDFSSEGFTNMPDVGFNDMASSIYVDSGWSVMVYEHDNRGGSSRCIDHDMWDLSKDYYTSGDTGKQINDDISSIEVFNNTTCSDTPSTWAYRLYSLGDFNDGSPFESNQSIMDLSSVGWNDRTESIKINSGYEIIACEHSDLNGTCGRATGPAEYGDINALAQGLRDGLSSIRVCLGSCPSAPSAPSLSSPPNGSTNPSDYNLNFQWNSVSGATEYLIEWWGGPYSTMQPCGWSSSTSCSVGNVTPGHTYSWHVKARNSVGESGWSSTWSFTIEDECAVPGNTILSSPGNGDTINDNTPRFYWNAANDADTYQIQVSKSQNFDSFIYNLHTSNTDWAVSSTLSDGEYYWHVRGQNWGGDCNVDGPWSSTWSVVIDATVPPNTPANFQVSVVSQDSITLAWDDVNDESGYKIYKWAYDESIDDWAFLLYDSVGANTTSFVDQSLECEYDYFYEISAYNQYGESDHTGWIKATTDTCPSIANDDIANAIQIGSLPYSNTQNTIGATLESGEPGYSCGWDNAASVWYRFTPSTTGIYSIDTHASDYDTVLHVFEESTLTPSGCNDDDSEIDGFQSKLSFSASAGQSYLIGVSHYGGGSGGNLELNLAQVSCPSGSLCMTVVSGDGSTATYPRVQVLDSSDGYVTQARGGADGFVEIPSLESGTYTLVSSDWGNFIVDEGVSAPGLHAVSALGLPQVDIIAKDTAGSPINAKIVFADSEYGYGYVGYSYPDSPLGVYATPGQYDVTAIGYDDRYVLTLENESVGTSGGETILDASTLPTDTLTFNWDGFTDGNFHSYSPFSNYWFWMPVADGQSVTLSVSEEYYPIWYEPILEDGDDTWKYLFSDCCYTTVGGDSTSFTVGGTFTPTVYAWDAPYGVNDTGSVYMSVEDSHSNWMTAIWHWDADAGATSLSTVGEEYKDKDGGPSEQVSMYELEEKKTDESRVDISSQGTWIEVVPEYQVTNALGNYVSGAFAWSNLNASYDFDIPDSSGSLGTWQAQGTIDFGPYQADGSDTLNFDVVAGCTFSGTIDLQGRSDDSGATFTAGAYATTTDADGHYELIVPEGTYDVTAEMDLYLDSERLGEFCPAGGDNQLPDVTLLGGDTNDDCTINILDITFMGARFGTSTSDADFDPKADINTDGTVNILDLTVAGGNFHETCPVAWP